MDEGAITHDSMSDSANSKDSADALIAKSPSKKTKFEFKLGVSKPKDNGTETQKDTFKWIPNPTDSIASDTAKQSTLESVSSTTTTSDFSSTGYARNGYVRSNAQPTPLLKYNEFSSLLTTLSTCPVEVKPAEAPRRESAPSCRDDELSVLLITGGIQMMLGILMAVFGVLIIVHDASLAGAGSGLWGGAVALLSGLLGVLAGMKGCFPSTKTRKVSPALLTAFLAMCLISFALSNLVLVLTATGLIRDINLNRSAQQVDESQVEWAPVLSDAGLIMASVLQCIIAVISGYKCYRKVCPCAAGHSRLHESDSHMGTVKPEKKVSNWLGHQLTLPKRKMVDVSARAVPVQPPWATPSIVLLPPPPPRIPQGPLPLWTFLQPPPPSSMAPSVAPSSQLYYCPSVHQPTCCCHQRDRRQLIQTIHTHTPAVCRTDRKPRRYNYIQPDPKGMSREMKRRESRRERRVSAPTAEEVAKTYTGRDREIAEEFISIAMDKGRRRSRANSVGAYVL